MKNISTFSFDNLNLLPSALYDFKGTGRKVISGKVKKLFGLLIIFSIAFIWSVRAEAGLKTDNVIEVTAHSMTIQVKAPSADVAPSVSRLIMVLKKGENPQWFPVDGTDYTQEDAETAAGPDYIIVMEDSSNEQEHEITINNLEMGTRYLFKPWFQYSDGSSIKYISSGTQYASDEFYRHQEVLNTIASELAKLTYELKQKQELPESSFTQTLLNNAVEDAKEKFKEGVTEGIKNFVMDRVLKKAGVGALSKFSETNRAKITKFYDDAKAVYDQGKEYAEVLQTVNDGLQADNPALELSRAAVTVVAPYAEPLFYVTELAVEAYVETAGIKAEIEVLTEATERMKEHLDVETQRLLEEVKSETYYGFCVTDLGGVLNHDLNLKLEDMPYVVSSDLIVSRTPADDDEDGKVTLSIPHTENLIVVWLKDGVNIIVEEGAKFDVEGGIFDRAEDENWGAIIYKEGALGKFVMTDVYNGGKNQDAQLIIRSSGDGDNGFELYTDLYASESAGVLIENAKVNADVYVGAKHNQGPGIWLKNPVAGTFLKRVVSKYNYQGILFQGNTSLDNAEIRTGVGTKIEGNQHPGTPVGSEDLVFMDMDYSSAIGEFINNMNMLKPIGGILFMGKEVDLDGKTVRKFTIPSGTQFSISDGKLKTIRFTDYLRVEGKLDLDGEITVLADSENIHGFIDVENGGELDAADVTFTCLASDRNWDGIRFLEGSDSGILDNVTVSDGGAGSIGAQLTIESNVSVTDSLFTNSQGIGVKVDQPVGPAPVFTRNKISFAKKHGLYTYNAPSQFKPRDNIFEASNGDGVHYFAVYATSADFSKLDAVNNYWDDDSGPTCADNPLGLGATAGALVDFDPWIGKSETDTIPDSGHGSPVFNTRWDKDINNGGYYVRAVRHSPNVLSIDPLTLTEVELQEGGSEVVDGTEIITTDEQLFTCYADGYYPGIKVSEDGTYLECHRGTKNHYEVDTPGHKICFTRAVYSTVTNTDTNESHLQYRIVDRGYYIPFRFRNSFEDITIAAGGSPYFMQGRFSGKINIEPGVVILMADGDNKLLEDASLNARGATFISVSVPDLDGNDIISDDEIDSYMNTIHSLSDIKPQGNNVKFTAFRGCSISMDNCLVINSKMGHLTYSSSESEKGCDEANFTIKDSRLYNFSLCSAGGSVEINNNLISTYSPDPPDVSYDTTYYIYASTANGACPVSFKNNRVYIPSVKGQNAAVSYEVKIIGGRGGIEVTNNEITGGVKLAVSIKADTQSPSSNRVIIENNKLYDSEYGIKISSYSSTPSKFFNINRLKISNNYVRTGSYHEIYCGTERKIAMPGLAIENFDASDIAISMIASNNDVGLFSIGGKMYSGEFTLTPDLAEGLSGKDRTVALFMSEVYDAYFRINEDATFIISGTEDKPVTILSLLPPPPTPSSPGGYINVYGEFNAEHTCFKERCSARVYSGGNEIPHTNGIRYREGSRGILNNIMMTWMNKGVIIESSDVTITNSIFSDNNIGVEIFDVSTTVTNNRFVRNSVAVSLDVDDPAQDTFTANPVLEYNIFEANSCGFKMNRLAGDLSLTTGNKFIGDNNLTGIKIENYTGSGSVNAANIYWGDNSGPNTTDNPERTGVKIEGPAGVVTYDPWMTTGESFTVTPSTGSGEGSINPSVPQAVDYGETIQFYLTPDNGYHLDSVAGTCSGTLDTGNNTFTTAAVTQDCTVIANFEIDTHTLEVKYLGRGTVTGNGINCPADCTEDYNHGTDAILLAKGDFGYGFNNWLNCDNPSGNHCTMTMDGDKTCTAVFTKGDISGDGNIGLADAILILKAMAGVTPDGQGISNYIDINGDQRIGLAEAISILQKVSGL